MKRFALLITLATAAAGAAACGGGKVAESAAAAPIQVTVERVAMRPLPDVIEVGGTVRSRNSAVLTSRVVGQVREVRVAPGQHVKRGTVLVTLDSREMNANRSRAEESLASVQQGAAAASADKAAAEAALELARASYERIASLRAKNSATPHEMDEATSTLKASEARLRAADARVAEARAGIGAARAGAEAADVTAGYATITAPFDAVVTEKHVDPGAMTMPGTPIVTVEDAGEYRVEARLDESRARLIDDAQAPTVAIEATGSGDDLVVNGRIAEREHAFDAVHTTLIKVALPPSPDIRTGMFARVRFQGPAKTRLAIPADALVRRGQLDSVFVVDADGRARYRLIETGQRLGDLVEIRAGLGDGEVVVRAPQPALVDGAPVKVVTRGGRS